MKKKLLSTLLAAVMVLSLMGCAKDKMDAALSDSETEVSESAEAEDSSEPPFDYLAMDIYECKYPAEFTLEEDLSQAIWLYAYLQKIGGSAPGDTLGWKQDFSQMYIENTLLHNDYIDSRKTRNNGIISKTEVEYVQFSLTGQYVSFDSFYPNDEYSLENQEKIIKIGDVEVVDVKDNGDTLTLDVNIKTAGDGFSATVELQKDPYSCFTGYNILSVSIS